MPGRILTVLVEDDAVAHRQQVLARDTDEILQGAIELAFIGPEIEIALGNVELRVGKQRLAICADHAADMIGMGVGKHHRIDIFRLDAGGFQALLLTAGGRTKTFHRAKAGIEQNEFFAGVHDRRILFEHDSVRRQEIVAQHLAELFFAHAGEGALGVAERQRSVGDDADFGIADLETVETGCLRPQLRGFRKCRIAEHGRRA
jgi:hypothetical protein